MYSSEDTPHPAKRQKLEQERSQTADTTPQLTLANLLLGLPSLLLHPPTHTNHERSLALSHQALRTCTSMTSLDSAVECSAATGLAELGLQIGLSSPGIEAEIQKAISKGVSGLASRNTSFTECFVSVACCTECMLRVLLGYVRLTKICAASLSSIISIPPRPALLTTFPRIREPKSRSEYSETHIVGFDSR